jgi:hypothetical protein
MTDLGKKSMKFFAFSLFVFSLFSSAFAAVPDTARVWLKVEVETSYGWFWQTSVGHVQVLSDPDHPHRIPAGKLCARLIAHDTTVTCLENADSLVIIEKKRGIFIGKREARLSAWAENPAIKETSVSLKP